MTDQLIAPVIPSAARPAGATAHWRATGHPVVQSFEPGEDWFWNWQTEKAFAGPQLAQPGHHPADQPVPGPADRVPRDWRFHVH